MQMPARFFAGSNVIAGRQDLPGAEYPMSMASNRPGSMPAHIPPVVVDVGRGAYSDGIGVGARRYARPRFRTWHLVPKPQGDVHYYRRLRPRGVIIQLTDPSRVESFQALGCPVVNVGDNHSRFLLPTVISDHRAIGRMAGEYLYSLGRRHFGFYGPLSDWYAARRHDGYAAFLESKGHHVHVFRTASGGAAADTLHRWLLELPKPAGLLAANDVEAVDVLDAAVRIGLHVPEDLALLGVDNDLAICEASVVPLSSVAVDAERVGYEAAALLDRLLQGAPPPTMPVEIPPRLVVERESTGITAITDPTVSRAVNLLQKQYAEPLTISYLAERLHVSERTLHRRFHHLLGRGPAEELRRIRIERAKLLLIETNRKVIDIALDSGFSGAPQFSSVFREATGMTPVAFRNTHRYAKDQT